MRHTKSRVSEGDCFPGNNGVLFDKVQKVYLNRKKEKEL